jgi:tetratricopeptide (TPR) repeat protein
VIAWLPDGTHLAPRLLVDQRERWQALQSHLSTARALVDAGDRAKALEAIDAALAIDPDFLAAHSLRDCILAPSAAFEPTVPVPQAQATPAEGDAETNSGTTRTMVASDGYAKFEARAKRRRVDRRIDAARAALERRRLKDAEMALDEISELDPNLPELAELTMSLDQLRSDATATHRGPWIAAAASFAVVLFGATWLQQSDRSLPAIQTAGVATPVETAPAPPAVQTEVVEAAVAPPAAPIGTSGNPVAIRDSGFGIRTEMRTAEPQSGSAESRKPTLDSGPTNDESRAASPNESRPASPESRPANPESRPANPEPQVPNPEARAVNPEPVPGPIELLQQRAPTAPTSPPAPTPSIAAAIATSTAPTPVTLPVSAPAPTRTIDTVDEIGLVRQTLQRYRVAYDGLDAQSAQAVYPAVNQAALARAFDGLESQTLTFDACDVQLRGDAAIATCRGSARYVPKIGSREPRIEPRTWNFTLRKAGTEWKIDSARAER